MHNQAIVAREGSELRITSPLPGSTYLLDPDVRSSERIPLVASGGEKLVWQSETLRCETENGLDFARAEGGAHRLMVIDPKTGRAASVEISVRAL